MVLRFAMAILRRNQALVPTLLPLAALTLCGVCSAYAADNPHIFGAQHDRADRKATAHNVVFAIDRLRPLQLPHCSPLTQINSLHKKVF